MATQVYRIVEGSITLEDVGDVVTPPDDDDTTPPPATKLVFWKPVGSRKAPIYETFTKANGRKEAGEKIIGYVEHLDQVIPQPLPDPMANTFDPAEWRFLFIVGRTDNDGNQLIGFQNATNGIIKEVIIV